MTIKEVIKLLKMYPADTQVLVFDEGVSTAVPVTGMVYEEKSATLELTTDDPC